MKQTNKALSIEKRMTFYADEIILIFGKQKNLILKAEHDYIRFTI